MRGMKKINLVLSGFILSMISLVSADAGDGYYGMMGGMMGSGWGYGMMGFGWLISVLVIVVLVLLIVWLIKQIGGKK